ncbi:hypothetical protein [Holdemanella biformis]|uniref:DUF4760 domain-containing protein n=1 Tax=Holdemanella biformis TaxID=1735 RepID=A0A395W5M7_9FIRM|nr:hypothetical protein [Holdemanella biformis]RGU70819.1 hypothetical protein DWW49_07820 [Holdemanella biformis]RGU90586.1 hypothetical protein DWW32_08490 [Holdemanella biformis]
MINILNNINDSMLGVLNALFTLIGFAVTIYTFKRSLKNELIKTQNSITLDQVRDLPYEILDNFDKLNDDSYNEEQQLKDFSAVMKKIYAYGSKDSICIISKMQEENLQQLYTETNKLRPMCFYILLVTQIKFDVTGDAVSPELWYKMKINDYHKNKTKIKIANNEIVNELHLNKKFKI